MRHIPAQSLSSVLLAFMLLSPLENGHAAALSAATQSGAPGQTLVASIAFSAQGQPVSGLQFDLAWDSPIDVKIVIGNRLRASTQQMYAQALGPRACRYMLIGMDGAIIPDGEVLEMFVIVDSNAQTATAQARFSNLVAADSSGAAVTLQSAAVNVQIQGGTSPPARLDTLLNSASLARGPVAPGEIVTVFAALPPAPLLFFNGIPAPLLYADSSQMNAVVPFGLDVSAPASVELRSSGQTVSKAAVSTAVVSPAIFTQTGAGTGPGAILNQDYSLNTNANPAAPGSTIMIYGTGFGKVSPAAVDGQVTAAPAATALPVTATIGETAADVVYAGAAPGLVAGIVQINVKLPQSLRTDSGARLTLSVGSVSSTAGVTVSIR